MAIDKEDLVGKITNFIYKMNEKYIKIGEERDVFLMIFILVLLMFSKLSAAAFFIIFIAAF